MHSGTQPLCSLSMRHLRGWKLSWEESWGKAPTGKDIVVLERSSCRWSSIPLSVWNVSRTRSPGKPLRTSISTKPERLGFCSVKMDAELVAAGLAPKNIYAYGFSRYHHIGGQGATLPLALFMLRAKSKKFRLLGKATLVPSIFNINEPLQYGAVVGNPFMLIPTVLIAIILPGFSYLWFAMGWGTINYVNFDMNFAPNAVSAFFMSGGDWRNVLLICINFVLAALIWYPFFKAADKAECKKEAEREAAKAAKKAAKAAVKA